MSLDSKSMRYHVVFSRIERLLTDVIICGLVYKTRRIYMSRRVIFFDIDGTIYHPEIGISQNTIDEIHRVQKSGHKCFIASGRPTGFISKEVKSIGFDGFVLANGAHIVTEGKTIDSLTLPLKKQRNLLNM